MEIKNSNTWNALYEKLINFKVTLETASIYTENDEAALQKWIKQQRNQLTRNK